MKRLPKSTSLAFLLVAVMALPAQAEKIFVSNEQDNTLSVIEGASLEVIDTIADTGRTPDILDFSPDSRYAFVTLRGPNPVSMPNMAQGETPGFSVIEVESRELLRVIQPAEGNPDSDFHGIAVRPVE